MIITDENGITPVEVHDGLYTKREDLYRPFGNKTVNGGKLRQCYMLVKNVKDDYDGVISCCSLYSPQAPITSAVAKHFGLKCVIGYGGTNEERLKLFRMPTICKRYGAELRILSKSGIHKILYNKAKEISKEENLFIVDYGFNITQYPNLLFDAISSQVVNIPDYLDNLVITCGSGITTIGVLLGIAKYKKKVNRVILVCTAPNRKELIDKNLRANGVFQNYEMVDLFHQPKFKYEKGVFEELDGITLHPNYEAKSYRWLKNNIDYKREKTLLWIVGSKPIR